MTVKTNSSLVTEYTITERPLTLTLVAKGKVYTYQNATQEFIDAFVAAPSKGKHFNQYMRKQKKEEE